MAYVQSCQATFAAFDPQRTGTVSMNFGQVIRARRTRVGPSPRPRAALTALPAHSRDGALQFLYACSKTR